MMDLIDDYNYSSILILRNSKLDNGIFLIFVLVNYDAPLTTIDILANSCNIEKLNVIFI